MGYRAGEQPYVKLGLTTAKLLLLQLRQMDGQLQAVALIRQELQGYADEIDEEIKKADEILGRRRENESGRQRPPAPAAPAATQPTEART